MGWLPFKNELRELIYENGLAEGWLGYKSEALKSNSQNGLAVGWLPFKNELRELIYGNGLAEGWLVYILDIHAVLGIWAGWDQMGWPAERLFSFVHLRQSQQMGWLRLGLAKKPLPKKFRFLRFCV